ncbi:hypothetical protein HPB49_001394 [Dermacentor silvarum]|uniref:Uncharacterized protein n=1 Tax=Dermacentor silvarum TaxID=543639 RepID=A0ACB8DM80_DERSI|nr:hypothetical protein HPB49_001394 [Dermacentor silvarum]
MLPSATPTRPWEEVGVDLFHLNGQDYVLLVDYRSLYRAVGARWLTEQPCGGPLDDAGRPGRGGQALPSHPPPAGGPTTGPPRRHGEH